MSKTQTDVSIRLVAVVQCAIALERCSGFSCAKAFHDRSHYFRDYEEEVLYVPFSCGGCPGKRVSRLAAHVARMAEKKAGIPKEAIAVHFTGCVVRDNGHYPECPFKDYMKSILRQKGLAVVEGGYESGTAACRRKEGYYVTGEAETKP